MKRSAFRGRNGQTAFSKGFLCVLLPFLVSAKVSYAYFVLKYEIFKMAVENPENRRKTHNASES